MQPEESTVISNEFVFNPPLKLYIVVNGEGKYFKSVGYSGYGTGGAGNWVEDINKAKVYLKIGQARSRVTYFAKNPAYPIPEILEITAGIAYKLDETKRVEKALAKIKKEKEESASRQAKYELEAAQRKFDEAQRKLNALRSK